MKVGLAIVAGIGGTAVVCGLCGSGARSAAAESPAIAVQVADTAVARLHISGMTCGSCATTARIALRRLTGVYGATVTAEDSLGVVQYDPRQVTVDQIVAHLARLTGYRAAVLPGPSLVRPKSGRS